ncbi:trimethyllysine dioxygenase [Diutina catenulata]
MKVSTTPSEAEVVFDDGTSTSYHHIWLRDNCRCEQCVYPLTKQRLFNSADIPTDILPKSISTAESGLEIEWPDGHKSSYDSQWLRFHAYNPRVMPASAKLDRSKLAISKWGTADVKDNMPRVDYEEVMNDKSAVDAWAMKIWRHGFCLIDNVPVSPEATEALCTRLDWIKPTHYGGFWDFTSDLSKADTAYTNFDIANHTDGTYWSDTPGLQLFHLLHHHGTGGITTLVDAFRAADILKERHPESYEIFCKIPIPAHSAGEPEVCIQPDRPRPVFSFDEFGELQQVRWNQSDRSTMDVWADPADVPRFYQAIKHWVDIITDPDNEVYHQLKPGQALIFDNWRVFHSRRTQFTGSRRMCGAYHSRDDFVSKVKLIALGREAVLDAI